MSHKISFLIVGVLGIIFFVLVILSCAKVSADSERRDEEWRRKDDDSKKH